MTMNLNIITAVRTLEQNIIDQVVEATGTDIYNFWPVVAHFNDTGVTDRSDAVMDVVASPDPGTGNQGTGVDIVTCTGATGDIDDGGAFPRLWEEYADGDTLNLSTGFVDKISAVAGIMADENVVPEKYREQIVVSVSTSNALFHLTFADGEVTIASHSLDH